MIRELLFLVLWLAGWLAAARRLFLWQLGVEGATILGFMWPVLLLTAVAAAPFLAVGWVISRGPGGAGTRGPG